MKGEKPAVEKVAHPASVSSSALEMIYLAIGTPDLYELVVSLLTGIFMCNLLTNLLLRNVGIITDSIY